MVLTAAQAARKKSPAVGMACLLLAGLLLRLVALGRSPGSHETAIFAALSAPSLHVGLCSLHFDGHLSFYSLIAYGVRAMGAGLSILRSLSCGTDVALGLAWMLWLRRHGARAAALGTGLWATAPIFLHHAVSVGPHAALALWTGLSWMAMWPVWQKARPSQQDKDLLTAIWAVLIFVHPLGLVVIVSMVLTAVLWPHASAAALANSLTTGVGQAGRLVHNLGRPTFVAVAIYIVLVSANRFYPPSEQVSQPLTFNLTTLAYIFADLHGLSGPVFLGPVLPSSYALPWLGFGITALWFLAAWSHPVGRKLATSAALYGLGLAAYAFYRPVFYAATLVPAWALLIPGAALGLAQARPRRAIVVATAALVLWQTARWLPRGNSTFDPPEAQTCRRADQ